VYAFQREQEKGGLARRPESIVIFSASSCVRVSGTKFNPGYMSG